MSVTLPNDSPPNDDSPGSNSGARVKRLLKGAVLYIWGALIVGVPSLVLAIVTPWPGQLVDRFVTDPIVEDVLIKASPEILMLENEIADLRDPLDQESSRRDSESERVGERLATVEASTLDLLKAKPKVSFVEGGDGGTVRCCP